MNICLKTYAKQTRPTTTVVTLSERLPSWIESSCKVECTFQIQSTKDYYLLQATVHGTLPITCQRCLSVVEYPYESSIELALCQSEEKADQLMSTFDCIVVDHHQFNLEDVLTDELHLSSPEIPHEIAACHLHQD